MPAPGLSTGRIRSIPAENANPSAEMVGLLPGPIERYAQLAFCEQDPPRTVFRSAVLEGKNGRHRAAVSRRAVRRIHKNTYSLTREAAIKASCVAQKLYIPDSYRTGLVLSRR